MSKAEKLLKEIETLEKQDYQSPEARLIAKSARLAEIATRRIIQLTWALLILTGVLLAYTVFLYKDTHTDIQHRALTDHHELQTPKPPEPKP